MPMKRYKPEQTVTMLRQIELRLYPFSLGSFGKAGKQCAGRLAAVVRFTPFVRKQRGTPNAKEKRS